MEAQVIASVWIRRSGTDRSRQTFRRGQTIDVSQAELDQGVEDGTLREPASATLPPANHAATDSRPTAPGGAPIDVTHVEAASVFKAAKSHAEADANAAGLGVTFPKRTSLAAKNEALEQIVKAREAAAADQPTAPEPVLEDLSELDDAELIQRGIDFGHSEDEMAELSHNELVLFVAEAQNRRSATAAGQTAALDARE